MYFPPIGRILPNIQSRSILAIGRLLDTYQFDEAVAALSSLGCAPRPRPILRPPAAEECDAGVVRHFGGVGFAPAGDLVERGQSGWVGVVERGCAAFAVGGFGAVEGFAVPGLTVLVHCSEAVGMGFAGFAAAALDVRGLLLEVDRLGV
jgi:hypothetical protein